jgi:hypothetical protein
METAPENQTAPAREVSFEEVTLEQPIVRGSTTIDRIQLRRPTAGELRGLQMQSLGQGDVNAVLALIPRISMPPLIAQEAEQLEIADLAAITGVVMGFFMSTAERAMLAKVMGAAGSATSTG